jgi:hypothetical protein
MKFFFAAYHCWFKPRTISDSISVGFIQKLAVMTQYHCRFLAKTHSDMNRQWRPEYQCQLVLSLPVLVMEPTVNVKSLVVTSAWQSTA